MIKILETAIEVSDASLKLGFVRHLFELVTGNRSTWSFDLDWISGVRDAGSL